MSEETKRRVCTASAEYNLSPMGANMRSSARKEKLQEHVRELKAEYDALVSELVGCSMPLSEWGEKVTQMNDLMVRIATFEDEMRRQTQRDWGVRERPIFRYKV